VHNTSSALVFPILSISSSLSMAAGTGRSDIE
jgi:hypothetical protein